MFLIWTHLLVEQTVHDEEEGALLGVEQDEEHLEEEVGLVQAQNPSAAQDDRLGQDLEHDQPAESLKRGGSGTGRPLWTNHVTAPSLDGIVPVNVMTDRWREQSVVEPGVLGLRHVTLHAGQGGPQAHQGGTEQHQVHLE